MNYRDLMEDLKVHGTEQTRKTYGNHGVSGDLYGVSYAHFGVLKKKIKIDHELAVQLWQSGNHDARILATMIADPAKLTGDQLDQWVGDLTNYVITDAFALLAASSLSARQKMEKWIKSKEEMIGRSGWLVLAHLTKNAATDISDQELENHLAVIERNIHSAKNRVRDAMNSAVIAIGVRNSHMQEKALQAAARIGKVTVDHGNTNCKTPDAADYIRKTLAHKAKSKTAKAKS